MITTTTILETVLEDRLSEGAAVINHERTDTQKIRSPIYSKNLLMRTSSFDRIKQFPTYFCRQGSTEIAEWLYSSKIRISSYLTLISKQFHGVSLTASIYCAIALVAMQLITAMVIVFTSSPPNGLIFLLSCILVVAWLAVTLLANQNTESKNITHERRSRSRLPGYQRETKKLQ